MKASSTSKKAPRKANPARPMKPAANAPAASSVVASDADGRRLGRWAWLAAIVGGLAGAVAYDPLAWRVLIPLMPLGCFLAIRWSATPKGAFLRALACGWVFYFGSLSWLLTIRAYAPFAALGVIGVVLLGVYLGLYPALIGLAMKKWFANESPVMQFICFGSLWLLLEWLRTLGRLAMPLAQLGHAWAVWPGAIQIAQWLGELGVTLEVLYLAGLIFYWSRRWWLKRQRGSAKVAEASPASAWRSALAWVLLAVPLAWGAVSWQTLKSWDAKVSQAASAPGARSLNVAMIQPNIPQKLKLDSYTSPDENVRRELSEQMTVLQENMLEQNAKPSWQLVILPETSFTEFDFWQNEPLKQRAANMARRAGVDMLISASRDLSTDKRIEIYNTAFFLHRDGQFDSTFYDKMRLVPFGEGMPYFDKIPGLQDLVGIGSFSEGKERTLFTSHGLRFGVLICFESTFSSMARALAEKGADFLAVVTNDAWYGLSAGAAAHHHLSLFRAVETRRYVARCANSGISSIIAPTGRLAATLGLDRQGVVEGTVTPIETKNLTLFVRWGNSWLALPALLLLGGAARYRRRGRAVSSMPAGTASPLPTPPHAQS